MSSSDGGDVATQQAKRLKTLEQLLAIQATGLKPALDAASTLIAAALDADKVDAFIYDGSLEALVAVGTSNTPMGQHQQELGLDIISLASDGRTIEVFETGHPYRSGHVDRDLQELRGVREELGVRSKISVPLIIDGVRRGVVEVDCSKPYALTNDDQGFLTTIAHWVGLMIQRAELVEQRTREAAAEALRESYAVLEQRVQERTRELTQAHSHIQRLLHQVVTAQEQERRRIARELHDQLGQSITALGVNLAALTSAAPALPSLQPVLERLREIVVQLDRDVDRLTAELHPTILDDLGLLDAIQVYTSQWTKDYGIAAEVETTGLDGIEIPLAQGTVLYRVFQEALTNVLKHAHAHHVSIVLSLVEGQLQLIVEDDGQGFEYEAVTPNTIEGSKVGLAGMRERVVMARGTMTIETAPSEGTALYVRIPL